MSSSKSESPLERIRQHFLGNFLVGEAFGFTPDLLIWLSSYGRK